MSVASELMPHHVAIIMDGNGRWASERGKPRAEGHARGAEVVRHITEEASRLGLGQLTLYCLSSENWKRPQPEIDFLMELLKAYLVGERDSIMKNNLKLAIIGRREGLPDHVLDVMRESLELSAENTGMILALAINYGSRGEIVDAVRGIAREVEAGRLSPDAIDEAAIEQHLYTAGMTDPDLLIRTASEMRVSNFLLWQISYSELWVTPICWPDFDEKLFSDALADYSKRKRKFGGLEE